MKKTLSIVFIALLIFSNCRRDAFPQEVARTEAEDIIFVNGLFLIGEPIVEFALGGRNTSIYSHLLPYVFNNSIYFFAMAFPLSRGNLRRNFQFNLEFGQENFRRPRMMALYMGDQYDPISPLEPVPVLGVAQRGRIKITHVFLTIEEAAQWLEEAKLAF